MKEFDTEEMGQRQLSAQGLCRSSSIDYDKQLESTQNYEDHGRRHVLQQADRPSRARPAKSGSTAATSCRSAAPACTLGAYADLKAKGKKINVAYRLRSPRAASSCSPIRPSSRSAPTRAEIAPFLLKKDAEAYAGKNPRQGARASTKRSRSAVERRLNSGERSPIEREQQNLAEPDADVPAASPRRRPNDRCQAAAVGDATSGAGCRSNRGADSRGGARSAAVSLVAVPAGWHLLTKYRVVVLSSASPTSRRPRSLRKPDARDARLKIFHACAAELPAHPARVLRWRPRSRSRSGW